MISILSFLSNLLEFFIKNWKEILISLLFIYVISITYLYSKSGQRIDKLKYQHKKEISLLKAKYENKLQKVELREKQKRAEEQSQILKKYEYELQQTKEIEQQRYQKSLKALEDAKLREKEITNNLIASNNANERLHNTIRDLGERVSQDSREAESRLRIAQEVSFKECTERLREMESDSNRLANQLKQFDDSWPTNDVNSQDY